VGTTINVRLYIDAYRYTVYNVVVYTNTSLGKREKGTVATPSEWEKEVSQYGGEKTSWKETAVNRQQESEGRR
jgi:hypothetical protein